MVRRKKGRLIHGILSIDKPSGMTSSRVVQRLKHLTKAQKVGHTGALDPMATGVLPVVFGEATKFSQYGLGADKTYVARVQLGIATTTLDADGEVTEKKPVPCLTESLVLSALFSLTGVIEQLPPLISALKQNGQPWYKLARQGVEVERRSRQVTIHRNHLIGFDTESGWIDIEVHCSKGTYIRSIAESLADLLGTCGHLTALTRICSGELPLDSAHSLLELESRLAESEESCDDLFLPVDTLLLNLPRITCTESECRALISGQKVRSKSEVLCGTLRAYFDETRFFGLVSSESNGVISAKRMLSPAAAGIRGSSVFGPLGSGMPD